MLPNLSYIYCFWGIIAILVNVFRNIYIYYIVKWGVKGKNNFLKEITYMTRNVILFTQCKIFWISNDILQPLVSS